MSDFGFAEATARVRQMEQCFDALQEAARKNPAGFQEDPSVHRQWKALVRYYESGQWLKDYELDEQGLLPKELKRGVLSQDAVYNFLNRLENLQNSEVYDESSVID